MKKTPVYFKTSDKKLNLNQVKNEMLENMEDLIGLPLKVTMKKMKKKEKDMLVFLS